MPVPTRRFAVVTLAAVIAVAVFPGTVVTRLLAVNGVLVVALVVDWWRAPRLDAIEVSRSLPRSIRLGEESEVTWTVLSRLDRALRVDVVDELAPGLGPAQRGFGGVVPARGTLRATTELRPTRRGRYEPTEIVCRTSGPLGLAQRQVSAALPATVRVHPAFPSRRDAEELVQRTRSFETGPRATRSRGTGTDFDQLREYTVDDETRRIDWSATARAGRTIVRTFRAERNQQVVVAFDNGRVMAGRVADVPRAEHAMDATLALATVTSAVGDRCGLVAFDRTIRSTVTAAGGTTQVDRMGDALFDLEPVLVESAYSAAFEHVVARTGRRSLIVVMSDLVDQVDDALLPALPVLSRRHLVLVAAVRDPQVEEWADATPVSTEEAYRKAAAARTLHERHRTAQRIRAAGALVVDAAPGRLGRAVAETYLDVKATGRL